MRKRKILFPFYMEIKQHEYISKKAEETGRSRAAIMREWVDKCIAKEQKQQEV